MSKKTRNIILISICALILFGCAFCFFYFYDDIHAFLNNPEYITKIEKYIESLGSFGFAVTVILIVLQIVIAFIPGEPFELVAGIMFGTFGGLICVLIGSFIGSTIVFLLVRKLGTKITNKFFTEEKLSKYKFLNNAHNRNKLLFLIFLLPGTPKDLLTYFAPLTPIKYRSYILITTLAKIPSIISSTMAGHSIINGNLNASVIIYAITFGLAGLVIIIDHIIQKNKQKQEKYEEK